MTSLPLHPLLVHLPVVLIPLVAVLVVPAVFSRRWFRWTGPSTLTLSFVAMVGALLATVSGEDLAQSFGEPSALLRQHAEFGELARNLAGLVFLLLLVQVLLFWDRSPAATRRWGERWPVLFVVLAVLAALAAVADTVVAVQAGHAGAQLVWQGQ